MPLLRVVKRCVVGHQPFCVCPDFGVNLFCTPHSLHRFSLAALHCRFAGGATPRTSKDPEESSTEDPRFGNPGSRSAKAEKSSLIHPDISGSVRRDPGDRGCRPAGNTFGGHNARTLDYM